MIHAIPFPDIGPDIFSVDLGGFTLALRWYAMAYIIGILAGWRLAVLAVRRPHLWRGNAAPCDSKGIEDLITAVILGVVIGGRLGFVMFYQPEYYLAHPLEIPMIWQGGMAFHGGLLGVAVAGLWFVRRTGAPVLSVADLLALGTPVGLMLGRIANFINAELWGRPTDAPWGVIFPGVAAQDCPGVDGLCARHPSQLYEAGLEGLVLATLLIWLVFGARWLKTPGAVTGVFLAGYGLARSFVELFRQADAQFITDTNPMGYVVQLGGAGLTMGQLLSLPMILLGVALVLRARRNAAP